MFASPIDDQFLFESQKTYAKGIVVTLVNENDHSIKVSSNSDLIPPGSRVEDLKGNFLELKQVFFEYGSSEMSFKFVSFISLAAV